MAQIEKYAVRFHGGPEGSGSGIRAQVHLFDSQNTLIGWLDFYQDGRPLPEDKGEPHIVMSMPYSALQGVVDILRNESPVYINWQAKIKNAFLGTGQEEVRQGHG